LTSRKVSVVDGSENPGIFEGVGGGGGMKRWENVIVGQDSTGKN
jgi:hypothetical protein